MHRESFLSGSLPHDRGGFAGRGRVQDEAVRVADLAVRDQGRFRLRLVLKLK